MKRAHQQIHWHHPAKRQSVSGGTEHIRRATAETGRQHGHDREGGRGRKTQPSGEARCGRSLPALATAIGGRVD
jgi:hypothetical protein